MRPSVHLMLLTGLSLTTAITAVSQPPHATTRISKQRSDAAAFIASGLKKFEEGDLDGAIKDFTRAIQRAPGDSEGYYSRGNAKLQKILRGRSTPERKGLNEVIGDMNKAIQFNPTSPDAPEEKHEALMMSFMVRGIARSYADETDELDGAITDLSRVLQDAPPEDRIFQPLLHLLRGKMEAKKNDRDSAIADFTTVINGPPSPP